MSTEDGGRQAELGAGGWPESLFSRVSLLHQPFPGILTQGFGCQTPWSDVVLTNGLVLDLWFPLGRTRCYQAECCFWLAYRLGVQWQLRSAGVEHIGLAICVRLETEVCVLGFGR